MSQMTSTTSERPVEQAGSQEALTGRALPGHVPRIAAAVALAVALLTRLSGAGLVSSVSIGWLILAVSWATASFAVEGSRKGKDTVAGILVWTAFGIAMIPLVSLIVTVIVRGAPVLTYDFLNDDMAGRALLGEGGGIYHAIMGTVMVTALAAIVAIPIGILTAIYLVEYGKGNRISVIITFLVDVMTGIPSIVAGLFAVALFIVITGDPLPRLGIGGAVALALLMLPTVIRSVEEMLKLVPDDLREASYALGVPRWRTIVKVVLPTSVAGIVTGVTLAIARVAGETAPLLLILGTARTANWNPFDGPVQTLPVFIFQSLSQTAHFKYGEIWTDRVWGAALVLILIVMALNLMARFIGKTFAPKTGR